MQKQMEWNITVFLLDKTMIINLELKSEKALINTILLELSDSADEFSDNLTNIVFSDKKYTFSLKNLPAEVKSIRLYINNNEIKIDTKMTKDSIEIYSSKPPFYLTYGLADIIIEIDDKVFYSKPVAVAVKSSKKLETSIYNMIKEILSNDKNLLKTKTINDINSKKLSRHKNLKYGQELNLINDIINKYEKNFSNFSINPYTRTTNKYTIEKLEKLTFIDHKTLQYIAENPQELRYSDKPTGIIYNNLPIIPGKTLIKNTAKNKDIYENQQILGFLLYLSNYIKNRCNNIKDNTKTKILKYKDLDKNLEKEGYVLSNSIITLCSEELYNELFKSFSKCYKKITTLVDKYSKILNIKAKPINMMPRPTPIFLEISHYNMLFILMKKWFSSNKLNIQNLDNILNFPNADKLYELYTLVNLYNCIYDNNYTEIKRENFDYLEGLSDPYKIRTTIDNTYAFKKNNIKLYLYYQPVIFANIKNKKNDIDLCRADFQNRRYFVPDFLIKKVVNNITQYSILDSKWRSQKNLLEYDNGIKDTLYKYYCSIINIDNGSHVSKIWLVSGKNDNNNIYYHIKNTLNNADLLQNKFGIVNLSPEINKNSFCYIIEKII